MQGFCWKKYKKINDRKVIEWCLKQDHHRGCKNLQLKPDQRKRGDEDVATMANMGRHQD